MMRCFGYSVRINDGMNYYMQYKDEFVNRIYGFSATRTDPLIIDGGSNIGMSVLFFKRTYPQSRVIGFEPDPTVFQILRENVARNRLENVTLVNAGLGAEAGAFTFLQDGAAGGMLGHSQNGSGIVVRIERLSAYLDEPVDFLKLNIEGQELPVLLEAARSGKLRNVRQLVIEYHGWAEGKQQLGAILDLLDRERFRYMVHDFDSETCPQSKPPFRLRPGVTWFCLVYARQCDAGWDLSHLDEVHSRDEPVPSSLE